MNLHAVRRSSLVVIALGIALGLASSSAFPQVLKGRIPLNVKLGLWETTTVVQMSASTLQMMDTSKMTPQQKTQMEAAMKQMQQNAAKPHTMRTCLTQEKLDKGFFENEKTESCKQTVMESTSTTYGIKFQCPGDHVTSGEMHFVAVTPEAVKGTGTVSIDGKPASTSTTTGKWIGAACGEVK